MTSLDKYIFGHCGLWPSWLWPSWSWFVAVMVVAVILETPHLECLLPEHILVPGPWGVPCLFSRGTKWKKNKCKFLSHLSVLCSDFEEKVSTDYKGLFSSSRKMHLNVAVIAK